MRIFYDHQVFSLQDVGGASRYFFELLRNLAALPEVETSLFLGINRAPYPFHELPAAARSRVRRFSSSVPPGTRRYAINEALQTVVYPLSGCFDVYHPTYFRSSAVRARRVVITNHDCTYEEFPGLFPDAGMVLRFRRQQISRADWVICISEASRRSLLRFYSIDPARTCVVHHGLNSLPRSPQAASDLRSRMKRPFLLYVGVRGFHKNISALLQAFHDSRLSSDYDLLLLGGGPLADSERNLISSLELTDAVVCLPSVKDDLLAEACAAATLFVYPSLSEGFGMPPLEAMAAGCPVATSNLSAMPEVCQDAPIYFDPYDTASISRALLESVNDREVRGRAINRGREVAATYSWQKCAAETLAAYRKCQ